MTWVLVKDIRLPLAESSAAATDFAQKKLISIFGRENVGEAQIYRKSLDARHRDRITTVWSVAVRLGVRPDNDTLLKNGLSVMAPSDIAVEKGSERLCARPVVVGFGPAGMFAALLLAENGYRPIVIERGDGVKERIEAVDTFYRTGKLDTESNIQFGAGGAGTFSDGKLVTRINDSRCRYVLKRFSEFGAPESIMTEAKPHVGTDKLISVVEGIKDEIIRLGGEVRFRCVVKALRTDVFGNVKAVVTGDGEIECGAVIVATGHSARDFYGYCKKSGIVLEEKALSVGLRIEHLRSDVEEALFGKEMIKISERDENIKKMLGHAEYAYSCRENGRAVYTFCMCPGGEVVGGASEEYGVVVNGMSNSQRNGRNSNSAVCVSVTPEECRAFGGTMEFCRSIEKKAYELGGGGYRAPIETVGDFLSGGKALTSPSTVMPTYMGGGGNVRVAKLDTLFPQFVTDMLKNGIRRFGRSMKGFDNPCAVLTGAETRTSAPYRMTRGENGVAIGYRNLYPCGEGAGYAGGITSAAVDGIAQAMRIMSLYAPV